MKVYRIALPGQGIEAGPWSKMFRGQSFDSDLMSVVKGQGNLKYWLSEAFTSSKIKVEYLDVYELGINATDIVDTLSQGELLIRRDTLCSAKVIKIRRINKYTFLKENHRRIRPNDIIVAIADPRYAMACKKLKEQGLSDPWEIAKLAHKMLNK